MRTAPSRQLTDDADNFTRVLAHRQRATRTTLRQCWSQVQAAHGDYWLTQGAGFTSLSPISLTGDEATALRGNYAHVAANRCLEPLRDAVRAKILTDFKGKCPLCSRGLASQLDHHLPKQVYPEFSILEANLILVCGDCNFAKLNTAPVGGHPGYLHTYFDSLPDVEYLRAEITIDPFDVEYRLDLPGTMGAIEARIRATFDDLKLGNAYALEAVPELVGLGFSAHEFEIVRPDVLRSIATKHVRASTRANGLNHWHTALMRAVVDADDTVLTTILRVHDSTD